MIGQLSALLVLFGLIFALNLIPAFAPPTWMALAFIGFKYPATNPLLLALVGAIAATLGRITLAKLSHVLLRKKLFSEAHHKNIDVIEKRLEKKTALTLGVFLFYAFSPLPSNLNRPSAVASCSAIFYWPNRELHLFHLQWRGSRTAASHRLG
jgi:hypothetical protein